MTTSVCGCAASSSRQACASCGWSVRARTTWWWRTRRTRARARWSTRSTSPRRIRSAKPTSTRRFAAGAGTGARRRRISDAHDAEFDVHQAVSGLREYILENFDVRGLGDFAVGAFDEVPNDVLSVTVSVLRRSTHRPEPVLPSNPPRQMILPTTGRGPSASGPPPFATKADHTFDPAGLKVVPEWPLIYWWDNSELERYRTFPLVSSSFAIFPGVRLAIMTGFFAAGLRCPLR